MPISKGVGPNLPEYFWDPYLLQNCLTHSSEIWCGNTGEEWSVFKGAATPLSHGARPHRPTNFWDPLCTPIWFELDRRNLVRKLRRSTRVF